MRSEARLALDVAREAAALVMRVYAAPFDVEYKGKDDPVTRADKEANALIVERLARGTPGVPVVAEESDPAHYAGFVGAGAVWFVDPLDGTREFVARNGEFAVMIGLAEKGRATLGAIVAPAWGRAFVGVVGEGAWEVGADGSERAVRVSSRPDLGGASIVVSRSRAPARIEAFVASIGAARAVAVGSSGLKGVLVATGEHDAYIQPGRAGMRWDACATEALVVAAGGACTDAYGDAFDYGTTDIENSRGLVATNGKLHAALIQALDERRRQQDQKIKR
ncbi:MAG TPA: 3'(2'),5'-bisphosphate nucleotidase CysQ [Polyangiaceae bacterium]